MATEYVTRGDWGPYKYMKWRNNSRTHGSSQAPDPATGAKVTGPRSQLTVSMNLECLGHTS